MPREDPSRAMPGSVLLSLPPTRKLPVLTVSLASQWYSMLLVRWADNERGWDAQDLDFSHLEEPARELRVLPYVDHCPNPQAMERLAEQRGWEFDEFAAELVLGRWTMEVADYRLS